MADLRQVFNPLTPVVYGRNRILNPDIHFYHQMHAPGYSVSSVTPINDAIVQPVAGWRVNAQGLSGAGTVEVTAGTVPLTPTVPYRSLKVSTATGGVGVTVTGEVSIVTVIPTRSLQDIRLGTADQQPFFISFPARASVGGTYAFTFTHKLFSASDTSSTLFTYTLEANKWTDVILGPITGIVSDPADDTTSLAYLHWNIKAGSTKLSTAGTVYHSTTYRRGVAGAADPLAAINGFFELGGQVSLYRGTVPQAYEGKDFDATILATRTIYQSTQALGHGPSTNIGSVIHDGRDPTSTVTYLPTVLDTMFVGAPLTQLYSPVTGAVGFVRDIVANADVAVTVSPTSFQGINRYITLNHAAGAGSLYNYAVVQSKAFS